MATAKTGFSTGVSTITTVGSSAGSGTEAYGIVEDDVSWFTGGHGEHLYFLQRIRLTEAMSQEMKCFYAYRWCAYRLTPILNSHQWVRDNLPPLMSGEQMKEMMERGRSKGWEI